MPLYTGYAEDGKMHKEKGLARYLTISRLSDNSGLNPREYLWKADKNDLFDYWWPAIAPDGEDVNNLYNKRSLNFNDFTNRYLYKLRDEEHLPFLLKLAKEAYEAELRKTGKWRGIVLQCVYPKHDSCHRKILANEIQKIIKDIYQYDIQIVHL